MLSSHSKKPNPWLAIAIIAMACAGVSQAFGRFTYSVLLTDLRDEFGISNTIAGSLGSANLLAYLVGTLLVSATVSRIGLSRMTKLGVATGTLGLIILGWATSLAAAAGALVVTGLAGAAVWITAPGLAAQAAPESRRGTAIGLVGTGIGIGIVFAGLAAGAIESSQWREVYQAEAIIAVLVTIAALFRLPAAPMNASTTGSGMKIKQVPGWQRLLVSYGLFAFAMSIFVTFLVSILEQDRGFSASQSAFAFALLGVGTIVGGPVFGPLSDAVGRAATLHLAFTIMALTTVGVAMGNLMVSFVAAFVFGTAFTGVPTATTAWVADHVQNADFGAAFGVATLAFGVGLMLGPQIAGALADVLTSFVPVFFLAAFTAVAGALVVPRAQ